MPKGLRMDRLHADEEEDRDSTEDEEEDRDSTEDCTEHEDRIEASSLEEEKIDYVHVHVDRHHEEGTGF